MSNNKKNDAPDSSAFTELEDLMSSLGGLEGDDEPENQPMPEFHAPVLHEGGTTLSEQNQQEIDDFNYIRKSLLSMIEKGHISIEVAIRELTLSGHPRVAEVVGSLIKNVSDVSDKLLDLHKKLDEIRKGSDEPEDEPTKPSTVNNTQNNTYMFSGTPAEMLEMLEKQKNNKETLSEGEALDAEFEEINEPKIQKKDSNEKKEE